VDRIVLFPESGAFLFDSHRRARIHRFPYMAVYRVVDDRVEVLAVIGVRRDPVWIQATVSGRAQHVDIAELRARCTIDASLSRESSEASCHVAGQHWGNKTSENGRLPSTNANLENPV
jgi:hypothetical protein